MGIYYGVKVVERIGTLIIPSKIQPIIFEGRLVMILDNGVYRIAADVTEKSEYDVFYQSYSVGNWLSIILYSITNEQIKECPDEGRVESTYFKDRT